MKVRIRTWMLFGLALLMAGQAFGQRETIDRIVAVVGDQVVLASELSSQIQLVALQTRRNPRTEAELLRFQEEILDQMISDQLFLLAAREDTLIVVRTEEIDRALEEQVARISGNFDSYDQFMEALAAEGLTLRDLKKKYRSDVENQLLKQRFIQSKLYTVSVSKKEVEEFFNLFQDSIPAQPEAVQLAHILLGVEPASHVEDSVKQLATELRQRILDGADFAVISSQYSSGASGAAGGELGYVAREDVVPEFARAAFNLSVGDISGVIRTQFGYHVIKCEGKRDAKLRLRHILLAVPPSPEDTVRAYQLADSLLNAANDGEDFPMMAKTYSVDNDTRATGGELGWFATQQLPPEFTEAVTGWTQPGEIRGPITTLYGIHLVKLLEYQPEKKYTLENDFDRIKDLARQDKTGQMLDDWIEELKEKTYIKKNLQP